MDEARVIEHDGVYAVSGAITFDTVSSLYRQLVQVIENQGAGPVTFDFGGVIRSDSSAVALLAGVRLSALKLGATAIFSGLSHGISSLMSLYGVDWIVEPDQMPATMI